jgi:mono/diheme cytochrome c family protein
MTAAATRKTALGSARALLGAFLCVAACAFPPPAPAGTPGAGGRAAAPDAAAAITPQRARSLYLLHCAGCHRVDGSGAPAYGVPTMIDTLGQFQHTPAGRAFLVQVPGARNSAVTNAELAALTNWALRTFSPATLPADFKPYTAAEVSAWRAHPPADIAGARADIIATLPMPSSYTNPNGDKHD